MESRYKEIILAILLTLLLQQPLSGALKGVVSEMTPDEDSGSTSFFDDFIDIGGG